MFEGQGPAAESGLALSLPKRASRGRNPSLVLRIRPTRVQNIGTLAKEFDYHMTSVP